MMTQRFYIMPIIGTGTAEDHRRGKYSESLNSNGYRVTIIDYGPEPWCIARVRPQPTTAHHNALTADSQVVAFPVDLMQTVGTAASNIKTKLENNGIPADWVNAATTYRQLLRRIAKYFLLMQRAAGLAGDYVTKMFSGGKTLSTRIGDLPQAQRARLSAAADSFGLDRTGLNNNSTFAAVLKQIAHQMPDNILSNFEDE